MTNNNRTSELADTALVMYRYMSIVSNAIDGGVIIQLPW